jgi:hypothetical protein
MSDASEQQFSRGSSLSLFSGFGGTSSVSGGGSDPGGLGGGAIVNVDDLSDDQLETTVDDLKSALRLIILETLMFESYNERLLSGQVALGTETSSTIGQGSEKHESITTLRLQS